MALKSKECYFLFILFLKKFISPTVLHTVHLEFNVWEKKYPIESAMSVRRITREVLLFLSCENNIFVFQMEKPSFSKA